ncbi:helicase-related protein [Ruania zhangjianzhongii]|uniref:helicase-related protein n=1 Tax=Ruania zhangjianzhongii TaxID=2603206 RepID=UPI001FD27C1D|nr:helicase-related protein [Ruania zhangjianzhongii]
MEDAVQLEDLAAGQRVSGVRPGESVTVVAVTWHGTGAVELVYKAGAALGQAVLYRDHEEALALADDASRGFTAEAARFKLVAEAQRIRLAGAFDPMLAVATSAVEPLPHQIRAVYGEMLPRTPLRFLLADDPGAGKTIMAGLYIKELLLREDAKRVLIVAPGGLVEQWQDELFEKFGMRFALLTSQSAESRVGGSVFDDQPLLIARMDQLARNEELQAQLADSHWDLVVVDEAHRMAAHYFGHKLEKTRRFHLGELLGRCARHLLQMTATPHSGSDEDFQLFLSLLDRDRFEGKFRRGVHSPSSEGLMRRMVKEDLLTFEGRPLFPERVAETVPYHLTDAEAQLYEQVTDYVRHEMNRAQKLDGKRRNTVGFALTVLQRRLASSPEAIYRSLVRRAERLERHKDAVLDGVDPWTPAGDAWIDEVDEHTAAEIEEVEEELVDAATSARTVAELDAELAVLAGLIQSAKRVRDLGTDRKWSELRTILEGHALAAGDGQRRKLIIFTEHRDTLSYLESRIRTLLGRAEAVRSIHGEVKRTDRREITEEFTKNPDCQILLATDAAGEGLNLQAAHLMVNYDLPWNPNRIEQRFGRIHRIGQTEVCRLWNLVATNTREGEVFTKLLAKIEEQRVAYGGKVFDVLGGAFREKPLRDLLLEAIRYGDQPEVRARMGQVIDDQVAEGLRETLQERALATETLAAQQLEELRARMDDARARRLQPHYIDLAFRAAFAALGGRLRRREKGRYEITNVPAAVRQRGGHAPVATRYERVTFELERIEHDGGPSADLLAPGHPLHDSVMDEVVERWGSVLAEGAVLVASDLEEPHLLLGVVEEVVDGQDRAVARRFGYALVDSSGEVRDAGPAPYLDVVAAPESAAEKARRLPWLGQAEEAGTSWIIAHRLPSFLTETRARRLPELFRTREAVRHRLTQESNRLATEALAASEKQARGERLRESPETLERRSEELQVRMETRMAELDVEAQMSTRPVQVTAAAVVLPLSQVEGDLPAEAPIRAVATKEVERRGVEAVLAAEQALGRRPIEQAFNNPGYDVLSERDDGLPLRIEVKARLAGADDFFVTHNEVLMGRNMAPDYRLALVRVDPDGPQGDQVRYLDNPFVGTELGSFISTGIKGNWPKMWARGREPF